MNSDLRRLFVVAAISFGLGLAAFGAGIGLKGCLSGGESHPTPPPTKPAPLPPSPFGGDGLRALIVYESADATKLPAGQLAIVSGEKVRGYLAANAKEWRALDPNATAPPPWSDLLSKSRPSLPWLYVGNGVAGYDGPLPAGPDEAIAIFQRFVK